MPMMRSIHGAACPYRSFRIKSYQSANRTIAPSIKRTRIGNDMASNLRLGNQPRGSHRAFKNFSSAGGCHRVRRVQISVKASASDFKSPTHHHTKNERHRHTKTNLGHFSSAGGCHRIRRVQISGKASASEFKSPTPESDLARYAGELTTNGAHVVHSPSSRLAGGNMCLSVWIENRLNV